MELPPRSPPPPALPPEAEPPPLPPALPPEAEPPPVLLVPPLASTLVLEETIPPLPVVAPTVPPLETELPPVGITPPLSVAASPVPPLVAVLPAMLVAPPADAPVVPAFPPAPIPPVPKTAVSPVVVGLVLPAGSPPCRPHPAIATATTNKTIIFMGVALPLAILLEKAQCGTRIVSAPNLRPRARLRALLCKVSPGAEVNMPRNCLRFWISGGRGLFIGGGGRHRLGLDARSVRPADRGTGGAFWGRLADQGSNHSAKLPSRSLGLIRTLIPWNRGISTVAGWEPVAAPAGAATALAGAEPEAALARARCPTVAGWALGGPAEARRSRLCRKCAPRRTGRHWGRSPGRRAFPRSRRRWCRSRLRRPVACR